MKTETRKGFDIHKTLKQVEEINKKQEELRKEKEDIIKKLLSKWLAIETPDGKFIAYTAHESDKEGILIKEQYEFTSNKIVDCAMDFLLYESYCIDMNSEGCIRNATEEEIKLCKEFKKLKKL